MACNSTPCNAGGQNLGFACTPWIKRALKFVFVQTYDQNGDKNSIPYTATLDQDYFDALVNNAQSAQRWYPTPKVDNPSSTRAEAKTWESDTGSKVFLQEGARTISALILKESGGNSPQMQGKLEGWRDMSTPAFYIITTENQLVGKESADGTALEPIQFDAASLVAAFNFLNADTPQHIALSFDWSISEKDSQLRMFDCSELGGADLTGLTGMLDMVIEVSDSTVDGFTMTVSTIYGTPLNPVRVTGLTDTNLFGYDGTTATQGSIYNETTDSTVTVDITETDEDGVYTVVYGSAQANSDVLKFYLSKSGYEISDTKEVTVPVS